MEVEKNWRVATASAVMFVILHAFCFLHDVICDSKPKCWNSTSEVNDSKLYSSGIENQKVTHDSKSDYLFFDFLEVSRKIHTSQSTNQL